MKVGGSQTQCVPSSSLSCRCPPPLRLTQGGSCGEGEDAEEMRREEEEGKGEEGVPGRGASLVGMDSNMDTNRAPSLCVQTEDLHTVCVCQSTTPTIV